jgi:hypothetical protein
VLNEARLWNPTATLTSVTDQSVLPKSSFARSIRRRSRYWCGVSPNVRFKLRLTSAVDACAVRASVGTSSSWGVVTIDPILRPQEVGVDRDLSGIRLTT